MYKIGVDVMGFENDINEAIIACREFKKEHNDVIIKLIGDETQIKQLIKENEFEIINASEYVQQSDTVFSFRRKKDNTSIQIGANLLKQDQIDGLLSACNSGVFVFCLYSTVGLIDHIEKLAFMPTIPKLNGKFNLLDVGASLDVNENDLVKFAIMANEYAKQYTQNPVIQVLNIGTEAHKGNQLQTRTNELLKQIPELNYKGYIESNKLLDNDADVVVSDGFIGNIALKALEGTAKTIGVALKTEFKKKRNFFAALVSRKILKRVSSRFDYKQNAGAFVLGLNKLAIKTHGNADRTQFSSSLRLLYDSVKSQILDKIKEKINKYYDKK